MAKTSRKTYQGNSSGQTASFEAALKKALAAAVKGEQTNHFDWKLEEVRGDCGGIVGKNITVDILVGK